MKKLLYPLLLLYCVWTAGVLAAETKPTEVSVNEFYDPNTPEAATTRRLLDLMREDKTIAVKKWGGISLPGGGKSSLMMAIAGGTAPQIGKSWFHIIRTEIDQRFLYPLNEWVCKDYDPKNPMAWDKNKNGILDDDETCWEPWKKIPRLWRQVATVDGKIFGIPVINENHMGILYRRDMVRNAGLNPNRPPQTWDDFKFWCQKLTTKEGLRGYAFNSYGWHFLPWIQAAGGEPVVQVRTSPKTGKKYEFLPDEIKFVTPEGEDLSKVPSVWKANFDSSAGLAAARFYHTLMHQKWMYDDIGRPVDVSEEMLASGNIKPEDVFTGMAFMNTEGDQSKNPATMLSRGEVAMLMTFVDDLSGWGSGGGLSPDMVGWFPVPAKSKKEGRRVVQYQNHYTVMYENVGKMSKVERDRVWKVMTALVDQRTRENGVREKVLSGNASYVKPHFLKEFGYDEYIKDIPEVTRKNYEDLEKGKIFRATEPWIGFWLTMDMALKTQVIDLLLTHADFDYAKALHSVAQKANSGVMFSTPKETLDHYRPYVGAVLLIAVIVGAILVFFIIKTQLANKKSGNANANVHLWYLPYLLVLPAAGLIALWQYYPLLRGMVMAFQDYRIVGESRFTGIDNFIILALDKSFWMSLARTGYYVILNMTFGFCMPIILAILLTEIPKFKILYRTIFFLPHMTSALVIALLWKVMYSPTPNGFFNQMIKYLNYLPGINIEPQTWLQDPSLAMICCIIPSVWGGMGMASLIYIAALHSVPPDYYEAAEIDGAGIFTKLRCITLPTLLPLIIINFVGQFIGCFQSMGNIFLMTFGGPGEATTVTGLKIWIEAYNNLRFSMATSMAWVLGALLIGLTYCQIRMLSKVEYKKAQTD